jgi:hypothetical protein
MVSTELTETASPGKRRLWLAARAALLLVLAAFFLLGATEHARRVNWFKARGDQTSYLADAKVVYGNWHGQDPPALFPRNRMPLYAAIQAVFYNPRWTDDEFFVAAKRVNVLLTLILLALLYVVFAWNLPPLVATNLTLIVGFGYFIFRAGYVQSEVLFDVLVFLTFLTFCHLLKRCEVRISLLLALLGGALAALAQYAKAAMLPLVAILVAVYAYREIDVMAHALRRPARQLVAAAARFSWRSLALVVLVATCLGMLYPYLATSKRVFGRYFYNVNTTFYIWYDDWPDASVGTYSHGDHWGWPKMRRSELPSMQRYLREHTVRQIGARVAGGFWDMLSRSYQTFWYLKYVVLYVAFALVLAWRNRGEFVGMLRANAAVSFFMLLYAVAYLLATAFYAPISGTGTIRFLSAHIAPLMFVLSAFFVRPPFRDTRWKVGGTDLSPGHFHVLVSATMGLDLVFTLWPRLMGTYGGF